MKTLLQSENKWTTSMGAWFPGERVVFRGADLHVDLKDMDWMALYVFAITGRRFSSNQLTILNAIWTNTSFPDPRLWNNRVAALAGTARSTPTLAISAAIATSEATIYGHYPCVQALDFLQKTKKRLDNGADLNDLLSERLGSSKIIYGYGRPITNEDERIPHLLKIVKHAKMSEGPHLQLALEIEVFLLQDRRHIRLNAAGIYAALAADMNFSLREFHLFVIPLFLAGMPTCYLDARQQPEGTFFPFRCDRIKYSGSDYRCWN